MQARLLALAGIPCILNSMIAFSQNAIVGSGFGTGWGGACGTNSNFIYFSQGAGSSYTSGTLTPNNTGNQFWRLGIDWSGTIKQLHTNNTGTDEIITANTTYTLDPACVTSGAMSLYVASTSYRYIFKTKDAGSNPSNQFVVFEIQGLVQTINNVTQSPLSSSITAGQPVTVTANLPGALSPGQSVYLRYSSSNTFATSTVIPMPGSGTVYSGIIPPAMNGSGAAVYYYVFTSGNANVLSDGSNADFYTINLNNNSGNNYSYTVLPTENIYQHNFNDNSTSSTNSNPYTTNPTLTVPAGIFNSHLSGSSWSGISAFIGANGNGNTGCLAVLNTTNSIILSFSIEQGYSFSVSSFSFWNRTSSSANWSMTINGITAGSGTASVAGANTGTVPVANVIADLYGTINIVISLGGSGSFRLDDFRLNGNVIPSTSYNPVTGLTASNICFNSADVNMTTPIKFNNSNNTILVFAKAGSAIIPGTPLSDINSYTSSTSFGGGTTYENDGGAFCVYKGDGNSINLSNLTAGVTYYLLAYNLLEPNTWSTSASASFTTITFTSNVSGQSISSGNGQLLIGWTNPVSCFDEVMIIATDNASVSSVPTGDGSLYTPNPVFNDGTNGNNLNTNEYCIYKGTSTSVTMTGLVNGTTYNLKIFVRKGSSWSSGISLSGIPVTVFSGDFRSKQNGTWTSVSTWEQYSGGVWVAATTFPNSSSSDVTIQPGNTIIVDGTGPYALKNLIVSSSGKLYSNNTSTATNIYLSVFGNILCNGTLGNAPLNDNLAFNIEGSTCIISGSGNFTTSRLRKYYNTNSITALIIDMNLATQWNSSAAIYNGNTNTTAFNVTINAGRTVTVSNGGNVSIHGSSGTGFNNSYGTYTINGTLTISGTLVMVNSNSNALYPSVIKIGSTGVINTSFINAGASGLSGNKFSIASGGLLNISGLGGFTSFSSTNNTYTINPGSTIQYSAAGIQTVEASLSYSNLTISGTGTKSANNNVSVSNNLLLSSGTFSQSGFTTTISTGGSVTGNGGDFAAGTAGGTINFLGPGNINGTTAMNFNNLILNSGLVAVSITNCSAKNLNLAGGIFNIGSANQFNIAAGGSVNATGGNFSTGPSGGIINFNGSGIFSGNCNPYHVFISGGVNFGSGTVTIQNGGTLRINNGGYADTNGPFYESGSTLVYNTGNVYNVSAEWYPLLSSGRAVPCNVQIGLNTVNNSGLSFVSSNAWRQCNGSFIIGPSIGGSGYSFSMSNVPGGDLKVTGDWQFNNGSFISNDRRVTFNGTTNQIISGNLPTTFSYVSIDNTGTPGNNTISQLKDPLYIGKEFSLSNGWYNTGSGNSIVLNIGANLTRAGGDFINSPAAGLVWLKGSNSISGTPYLYDVNIGSGVGSTPVTFTNNATIHHYCTINSEGSINPAAPKFAIGSTLIYNPGGVYNRSIEWGQLIPLEAGYPHHVIVQNGTTLNLGIYTPANLEIGGDLSIGTSTSGNNKVTMNALVQPLKILGNLFIGDNASAGNELVLSSADGGDLELSGNFTRYASNNYFTYGNRSVIFNGSSNASVNAVAQKFYNITMQKTGSADLTLNCPVNIENNAAFVSGNINSITTNLITFEQAAIISGTPSSASYINGPAAKQYSNLSDEFIFPLGKAGGSPVFNPCGIAPVTIAGSTVFTAEYFKDPLQKQTLMGEFLVGMINSGYWEVSNSNVSSSARIKLYYTNPGPGEWIYYDAGASSAPFYSTITDPCATCNVAVVHRESATNSWMLTSDSANFNASMPEYRYYADNGFIYSAPLTSFSPFSIGYSFHVVLLLPVKLISFTGELKGNDGSLNWKVNNTINLDGFDLEYSRDGRHFAKLASINRGTGPGFTFLHKNLAPGNNYYRLLVKEKNGKNYFGHVVLLTKGKPKTEITGLLNNPVKDNPTAVIYSSSAQKAKAIIMDASGRLVLIQETQLMPGRNQWRMAAVPRSQNGMYFIQIETADGARSTLKFFQQ
jgi:hypothetical protein